MNDNLWLFSVYSWEYYSDGVIHSEALKMQHRWKVENGKVWWQRLEVNHWTIEISEVQLAYQTYLSKLITEQQHD